MERKSARHIDNANGPAGSVTAVIERDVRGTLHGDDGFQVLSPGEPNSIDVVDIPKEQEEENPFKREFAGFTFEEGEDDERMFLEKMSNHTPYNPIEKTPLKEYLLQQMQERFNKYSINVLRRSSAKVIERHNSKWRIHYDIRANNAYIYSSLNDLYGQYTPENLQEFFGVNPTQQQKNFMQLIALEPGTQAYSREFKSPDSEEQGWKKKKSKNARPDKSVELPEEEVEEKKGAVGIDLIRRICYSLQPEDVTGLNSVVAFGEINGNSIPMLLTSPLTSEDLAKHKKQLVDVSDKASADDFFIATFIKALENLWRVDENTEFDNQPTRAARIIVRKLQERGWTKEQIVTLVGKHFSIEIPSEYQLMPQEAA